MKKKFFIRMSTSTEKYLYRKWSGVLVLLIEMNLLGGTIYGFPAIFGVLSQNKIYQHVCPAPATNSCAEQTQQYQVTFISNSVCNSFLFFKERINIGYCVFRFTSISHWSRY